MTGVEFTALVAKYQGLVYTVCFQLVRDPDAAQDLAQETFLSAWRAANRCPAGYERQWLTRIATNKARDWLKAGWQRKVTAPGEDVLALSGAPPDQIPEFLVEDEDGEARLKELILSLREPYRTPARLCFLEQRPAQEAARICGRPVKTLQSQLYRAKKILQQQITERSVQDERLLE